MPKIKSNKSASKRFSKTGSGKIRRRRAYHSHILTSKDKKRKRRLRTSTIVTNVDARNIRRLLPYL